MATRPVLAALLASPRRRGRSASLLSAFCKPLKGWDIRLFHLPALGIHPCTACDQCLARPDFQCRQRDPFSKFIKILDVADALVLSSPVYYYGFPAQAKAIIDRTYPLYHNPYWQKHSQRPAFFLSVCAASKRDEFRVMVPQAKAFLNTLAFRYAGEVLVPGMDRRDAQVRLKNGQKRAALLGRQLACQTWNPA